MGLADFKDWESRAIRRSRRALHSGRRGIHVGIALGVTLEDMLEESRALLLSSGTRNEQRYRHLWLRAIDSWVGGHELRLGQARSRPTSWCGFDDPNGLNPGPSHGNNQRRMSNLMPLKDRAVLEAAGRRIAAALVRDLCRAALVRA